MFGEFKNFKCITFFHLCFTASSNFTGKNLHWSATSPQKERSPAGPQPTLPQ